MWTLGGVCLVLVEEIALTRTLHKFLVEHKHHNERCVCLIAECLENLSNDDAKVAIENYKKFMSACGLGRMGAFDDTGVSVVYEHENDEYVGVIFRTLTSSWARSMKRLENSQ